jgi:uncharacterized protein with PIN domain
MRTSYPRPRPRTATLPVRRLVLLVPIPLLLLALGAPLAAQPPTPAEPSEVSQPSHPPLTVYLTEEEPAAAPGAGEPPAPQATMAQAIDETMRARKAAASTTLMTGIASAVFLAVGLVAMRHRSRVCPRCSARLVPLGDPADAAADDPGDPGRERGDLWACPACGELGRLRLAGFLFRKNDRCPRCGRGAMRSGYTAVEPATYLMYGLLRIDEDCAACDYKASYSRSMPPNEAPPPDWPGSSMRP